MNNFLTTLNALAGARLFARRVPLAVSYALTFRCNQRCLYCRVWENRPPELNTTEAVSLLGELKRSGMRWISFTGGEPLLRDDIGEIVSSAKRLGVFVSVSSNGKLIPERIEQIKGVDRIKLSLDGPVEVNDKLRGEGSYDSVIRAIEACLKNKVPICLECVISKYNVGRLDYMIDLASSYNAEVLFQPATERLLWSDELNPVCAPVDEYRSAVAGLIKRKREGGPVYNSLAGLEHLYSWPIPRKLSCGAGLLSFRVEPNGTILACDRIYRDLSGKREEGEGIESILKRVRRMPGCDRCWCSSVVEFNLMMSLNMKAIINYLKK